MRDLATVRQEACLAIRRHHRFLITTHVNPDGDGIGSELALARFLKREGKQVTVLNPSPTSKNCQFLDTNHDIVVFNPAFSEEEIHLAEVVFIVDISKWERLGPMKDLIRSHAGRRICIDHHPLNGDFADINFVCEDACASGELVMELIEAMNGTLTAEIAEPLYASILTDTGAFRFPNTKSKTHQLAARLLATGIEGSQIYEQIYERCSPARVKLLGLALYNMEYRHGGRLAAIVITQEMIREMGVQPEEIEGFVDIPRSIRGVEASLLFVELPDQKVKVSLRSKGEVDVNRFANTFGGGGHRHAAGILASGPFQQTVQQILMQSSSLFSVSQKLVS